MNLASSLWKRTWAVLFERKSPLQCERVSRFVLKLKEELEENEIRDNEFGKKSIESGREPGREGKGKGTPVDSRPQKRNSV